MPNPENLSPEKPEQAEQPLLNPERELPAPEQIESRPAPETPKTPGEQLEQARDIAHESADSAEKNPIEELEQAETAKEAAKYNYTSHELETSTGQLGLQRLRRHETKPERALSRIVHQPAVRVVSEAASKTVSRPSGLLGGGIVALLGTSGYLYLAKHTGFSYNYTVFLLLFVGGFLVGVALETLAWLLTGGSRSRRSRSS